MKWWHADIVKLELVAACVALFMLMLGCASAPTSQPVARHIMQGCTAQGTVMGTLVYTKVVVVGITPQGTNYWVAYPDRTPRIVNGKPMAELLPVSLFIPRGRNGTAQNGRPCRCPEALWTLQEAP